jgi:hypothetical protein
MASALCTAAKAFRSASSLPNRPPSGPLGPAPAGAASESAAETGLTASSLAGVDGTGFWVACSDLMGSADPPRDAGSNGPRGDSTGAGRGTAVAPGSAVGVLESVGRATGAGGAASTGDESRAADSGNGGNGRSAGRAASGLASAKACAGGPSRITGSGLVSMASSVAATEGCRRLEPRARSADRGSALGGCTTSGAARRAWSSGPVEADSG